MDELRTLDLETKKDRKISTTGKVLLGVTGGIFTGICAITIPFVSPALRRVCLPYVPATSRQVDNVMQLLKGRSGTVVDLGSGDGRIVIEAAKQGFNATGIELNLWLVWFSKLSAFKHGVSKNTHFCRKDIWKADWSGYSNIIIFGVDQMMEQLEAKLEKELSREGHVIACRFPFPSWKPVKTIDSGIDTVWLYSVQNQRGPRLRP